MSKGKGVKGPAAPKRVEMKGVVSQVSKQKDFTATPAMDNKNGNASGGSKVKPTQSPSDKAGATRGFAGPKTGFAGESVDLHIKDETSRGHDRNKGSALRGGDGRNSSHTSGNRYGK
jgi:hypothetical protein